MSLALARKYRPRNFASVAVQTHVSRTLRGAIARDRIANAYLLCGPRGTGKTTLARVLAMALNCENRLAGKTTEEGEPCGECTSCTRIWGGSASLDVVEIDAASNRGVDDARELRERAMYAPSTAGHYKVYIVDEAHMLTREAWNALLKILEEPPPRVVFVFATTEPQKIAQAATPVLSRLQRFDLKRIGAPEIRTRLSEILALEGVQASSDAISMVARAADGSMRDALSLTDQVISHSGGAITVEAVRESLGLVAEQEYLNVMQLVLNHDAAAVFPAVERLADEGVDFTLFLNGFSDLLRAFLAEVLGAQVTDVSSTSREALAKMRGDVEAGDVIRMLNLISETEPRFRRSGQQQLLLESLLVRLALMDRTVTLADLVEGVPGPGERRSQSADKAPEAALPRTVQLSSQPADIVPAAPSSTRDAAIVPLDLNRLVEHWDAVVERLGTAGRGVLASHLAVALPTAVSARGVVTIQLDDDAADSFDLVQEALNTAQADLLNALRLRFSGVEKVVLAPLQAGAASPPTASRRLTAEAIKLERLETLRRKDPVLDAAIRELDLELLD